MPSTSIGLQPPVARGSVTVLVDLAAGTCDGRGSRLAVVAGRGRRSAREHAQVAIATGGARG